MRCSICTGNSKRLKGKLERQAPPKKKGRGKRNRMSGRVREQFLENEYNSAPVPREWSVSPSSPDKNIAEIPPGAEPSVLPLHSAAGDFWDKNCHPVVAHWAVVPKYPSTYVRRYYPIRLFLFRVHFMVLAGLISSTGEPCTAMSSSSVMPPITVRFLLAQGHHKGDCPFVFCSEQRRQ